MKIASLIFLFSFSFFINSYSQQTVESSTINSVEISPYSKLIEIPVPDVVLTEGFWKEKFDLVRDVTVPKMFEYMYADSSAHWKNFLIAAGELGGEWHGTFWHDGDFYKWMEAAVYVYQVTKDPELDKLMDRVIDVIGRVQEPDGYISTYIQLKERDRWQNKHEHELYNMGHLMTVAARHYEATGKTNLLETGKKTADYLFRTFAVDRPGRLNGFGFNPSNIMGCIDIYRATGDKKYLALADTFVTMRGTTRLGRTIDMEDYIKHTRPPGQDQNQDRIPFREESEAVGHSVTATYLYAGAADLYLETGEQALKDANYRIWDDVVTRKLAIHGGAGPVPRGLSIRGDFVAEAFDAPYSLPLRVSYNETCANIGNVMWNWRLYKADPKVKYLEIMETGIYNSGLSGFGLDGFSFYYNNPLRRFVNEAPLGGWNETLERSPHIGCYCCPPQLARHIAGLRHYLYSVSKDKPELWINFFASGKVNAALSNGTLLSVSQKTDYPWEGDVSVRIHLEHPANFIIKIPIPSWADGTAATLNGKKINGIVAGDFLSLDRQWNDNDLIHIELPMRIRLMKANPLVEQTRNQITVVRGPIVYCLESTDLPDDIFFMDVFLRRNAKYKAEFKPELLGGVSVIKTKALVRSDDDWSMKAYNSPSLYKETGRETTRKIPIQLIPYYTWSNRGISEMTVWIPVTD